MYWTLGFFTTFVVGGMTGVLMAIPPADFVVHNSLFLIAHFHNVLIPGALFGYFAGIAYWFPKAFGFRLDEKWGKRAFWGWIIGFLVAFSPLYILGFMGMARRMQHYDNLTWRSRRELSRFRAVCIWSLRRARLGRLARRRFALQGGPIRHFLCNLRTTIHREH